MTWPRAATTRSTRRAGSCWTRRSRPRSTCIRCTWCDGYPCLVHAKSDAEVIAVRPLLDRRQRHPAHRGRGDQAGDRRLRAERSPESSSPATVTARSTGPTSWPCLRRGRQQRQDPAQLGQRRGIPRGLANGSDQVGRNYMFHNCKAVVALSKEKNDTVFQKTLGINDFYFGAKDYQWPDRQHPDDRQVQRRGHARREAQAHHARPGVDPVRRGRARGGLLAHHRGPAGTRRTG